MIMRKRIELRWPESEAFFDDLAHFVADSMLKSGRVERAGLIFVLAAKWLLLHITESERLENEDLIVAEIAEIFANESPGFWKSIQDFPQN
jgi:hypothetical protein